MLATWLETNKTGQWSEGKKFIQFMKNRADHSGINVSPYEALFGCRAKVELKTSLPAGTLSEIRSEEYLEAILVDQSNDADNGAKHPGKTNSPIERNACAIVAVNEEDNTSIGVEENERDEDGTAVDKTSKNLTKQSLVKQADRMLKHSNARFPVAKEGQSVRVRIPEVDRAKADSRNIIANAIYNAANVKNQAFFVILIATRAFPAQTSNYSLVT
ncbi:uncharacterized protein [Diabrotica undecimpunctata]|uniref:uncharacterized protein n=1 Tax=Diabrotica undecimpunctata TaxID=50387 RepID=UPI003B637B44